MARIQQVSEKNEVSCMWGLFGILESCQGRPSNNLISAARPLNRHIIADHPRKIDPIAKFDEECRKIHNGASMRSVPVDVKGKSVSSCIGEMPVEKHISKQSMRRGHAKMDAELLDRLVKTHRKAMKCSQDAYQSSSSCLDNVSRSIPSGSTELSLNKLTVAAILGAVCAQNQQEDSKLFEYFQRNYHLGKCDHIDEISIQQVQMRAKAIVDQMFIDRKLLKEERNSESKSFSNALEVLNSKKGLFMELLPDPKSMLARRVKNLNTSQTEKDMVKSILGSNRSECEGTSAKPGTVHKEKDVKLWEKIDYQLKSSPKTDFTAQPSDKIVILKPMPRTAKHYSGKVLCNCSSLQFPHRSNRSVSEVKTKSYSFRKIKKKLKHTFGVSKKDKSTPTFQTECSFVSSTDDKTKGKLSKNQEIKSNRGSDIAFGNESTRRKLDFTSNRSSKKQEFDVLLEAKRHLSTRFNDLNSVDALRSKNSPTTLERILFSSEPELWPSRIIECSSHVGNKLMSNTEVTSCVDHNKLLETVDVQDLNNSDADNIKINGESKIAEMNFPPLESRYSEDVLSIPTPTNITGIIKEQKYDVSVMHSLLDSLPENEADTSAQDDFTSTAENIKCQEDRTSPVSVLEPFFTENANSPLSIITLQTAREQLQPRRLDFEECSTESFSHYSSSSVDPCTEEDRLCQYVYLILEASSLNWDQLSEILGPPDELLQESLFYEVELPPRDCCYDPKLLFDRINEVLLEIYKCHFCSPPWLASCYKLKIAPAPLAELVLAEILAEDTEFFLLPTTEKRTLEQIVSRDIANSGSWLDVNIDIEHIATEISEALTEESLLDTLLQLHT